MIGTMCRIPPEVATDFLLPRHYSGRKPQITMAWGWYENVEDDWFGYQQLKAVCTIGKPANPFLCVGICGPANAQHVYELNRLCREDDWKYPLSMFVSFILRECKSKNWIIVSYADVGMQHNGYIYQACNFLYTGITKERTDKYTEGNKHPRHYANEQQGRFRKVRTAKHRYVYFCTANKKLKSQWKDSLRYPIQLYPKGKNRNYQLGEYQRPEIITIKEVHLDGQ